MRRSTFILLGWLVILIPSCVVGLVMLVPTLAVLALQLLTRPPRSFEELLILVTTVVAVLAYAGVTMYLLYHATAGWRRYRRDPEHQTDALPIAGRITRSQHGVWTCPGCGGEVDVLFDVCPNCRDQATPETDREREQYSSAANRALRQRRRGWLFVLIYSLMACVVLPFAQSVLTPPLAVELIMGFLIWVAAFGAVVSPIMLAVSLIQSPEPVE